MNGSLTVAVAQEGRVARLSNVTCTLGRCDKPYPEMHKRAAWTIALVRRGTFRYRAAATNRAYELRAGWLLFGQPDAEFECSHEQDGGDECASLAISEEALWDVASTANIAAKKIFSAPPALPPLPKVSALLEHARRRNGVDMDELGYSVTESVVAHVSGAPVEVPRQVNQIARMRDAMERIEAGCSEPLSLTELAHSVGFSPFHFLRVFRRVTGTTPHQYLVGARLRLAAQMLLDTDRAVTEIAYQVGFQDLSNFVRTFHRVVGRSPRAYRRG